MSQPRQRFSPFARLLHWLMAALILAMLFIGIGMIASLSDYHWLLSIHRSLGIIILVLAVARLFYRLFHPAPSLPAGMPGWQRILARASHVVLYALMIALPLVGWAMLSAAREPVVLYGSLYLPPITPQDAALYGGLRETHTVLAFLLFATFLAHLGAALLHAMVFRDGVFQTMAPGQWRRRDDAATLG